MQYNKLVRDRIPAIIAESGRQCRTTVLTEPAFRAALSTKLVEEAQEVQTAAPTELLAELADVMEVFDTLLATHQLTMAQVRQVQQQRRQARGGFPPAAGLGRRVMEELPPANPRPNSGQTTAKPRVRSHRCPPRGHECPFCGHECPRIGYAYAISYDHSPYQAFPHCLLDGRAGALAGTKLS